MPRPKVYLEDDRPSPDLLMKSGYRSLDKFIGGGFQPGYPWIFVADPEAEGIATSAILIMSFSFASRGYPTFIMTTRSPWGLSIKRYQTLMPDLYKKLYKSCKSGGLFAVNFWEPPGYKSEIDCETHVDLALLPGQVYARIIKPLAGLKTGDKPMFWRLTSVSDLAHFSRYYGEHGVSDLIEPLMSWLQMRGATGVTSVNREAVAETLLNRVVSVFPNVAYVNTKLGKLTKYYIQVAKTINPDVSPMRKELKITPKYEIVLR